MIDSQELLFVVDENNNPQKPLPRSEVHKKGLWHRTSDIWVVTSQKQILCQKRSLGKDVKPGFWESFFGGHILAEQNELYTAVLELSEELGIKTSRDNLHYLNVFKTEDESGTGFMNRQYRYVYFLKSDIKVDRLNIEKDEVDEVKLYDLADLRNILLVERPANWVHPGYEKEALEYAESI